MNKNNSKLGFFLNLIGLVGIGSYLGGRTQEGIQQMIVLVFGWLLLFIGSFFVNVYLIVIGFAFLFVNWIWGLIVGVRMVKNRI